MRQSTKYIGLIFILVTFGCNRQTNDSPTSDSNPTITETTTKVDTFYLKNEVVLIVKDSTKYSSRFLQRLRHGEGPKQATKYELIDDSIIVNDKYKNSFGQVLPDNKDVTLRAEKGGNKYRLTMRQVNLTTISFDFELTEKTGQLLREKGEADLALGFMFGGEYNNDADDKDHIIYPTTEYFFIDKKVVYSIRIGLKDNKIMGKVTGDNVNLGLNGCPTLK